MAKTTAPYTENVVHASPTKDFFVRMITKDITLIDCILDLLDNTIDAAHKNKPTTKNKPLAGFFAEITYSSKEFRIKDNCGGIDINTAREYAFHFGRRKDQESQGINQIGLYGIGMKRAVFKMGQSISIQSSTKTEAFSIELDVENWTSKEKENDWDIPIKSHHIDRHPGTNIAIKSLHTEIQHEFSDPVFRNNLVKSLTRDYSLILSQGFTIKLNGESIKPFIFNLKVGEAIKPAKVGYIKDGVAVELLVGLVGSPPDDISGEAKFDKVERYGWFVFCNDRVVLAGDKSYRTGWGSQECPGWHPQYNGFLGLALFKSADPSKLPWTTTKRDVDLTNEVYADAMSKMAKLASEVTKYTGERKLDLTEAKNLEKNAKSVNAFEISSRKATKFPSFSPVKKAKDTLVSYRKPDIQIKMVAKKLGNTNMSPAQVGISTFEAFLKNITE